MQSEYVIAQNVLIVSMFLGFISARPTDVVSMVNLVRDLMSASRSSCEWGDEGVWVYENGECRSEGVCV